MSKLEKRLIWIDIAKGIGLFLVILGHMPSLPEWFRLWIFSFHMPLFFFLIWLYKQIQRRYAVVNIFEKSNQKILVALLFIFGDCDII